jgi:hypothetical protein
MRLTQRHSANMLCSDSDFSGSQASSPAIAHTRCMRNCSSMRHITPQSHWLNHGGMQRNEVHISARRMPTCACSTLQRHTGTSPVYLYPIITRPQIRCHTSHTALHLAYDTSGCCPTDHGPPQHMRKRRAAKNCGVSCFKAVSICIRSKELGSGSALVQGKEPPCSRPR